MQIDKNSSIPLYYQLKIWLKERINKGVYRPGDQIPTESDLCNQFNLSRGPVRQALKELINDGRLYLVRGMGTYVAEKATENWQVVTAVSFSEGLQQMGVSFTTKVLAKKTINAEPYVATKLKIVPNSNVIFLKRLRYLEGEPAILMVSFLIEKLVSNIIDIDFTNKSLYQVLDSACNVKIAAQDRTMYIGSANEEEARLLNIPKASAIQRFEDLAYDSRGVLVEYSNTAFRGDKSRFHLKITRKLR